MGQKGQPGVFSGSTKIKVVIIIILRPDLRIDPEQGLAHESGWQLTWFNVMIKMAIIIVLKFNSGVDIGQGPGGSTQFNSGQ